MKKSIISIALSVLALLFATRCLSTEFTATFGQRIDKSTLMLYKGSRDGLRQGAEFSLYKDDDFVGIVRLQEVKSTYSIAGIVSSVEIIQPDVTYIFKSKSRTGDLSEPLAYRPRPVDVEPEPAPARYEEPRNAPQPEHRERSSGGRMVKIQLNYADAVTVKGLILSMINVNGADIAVYSGPVGPVGESDLTTGGETGAGTKRYLPNDQIVTTKKDFLLIKSDDDTIGEIRKVVELVDVPPRQVIIKTIILELDKNNNTDVGADLLLFPSFGRYGVSMFPGDMVSGQYWVGIASEQVLAERTKTFTAFLHDQLLRRKAKILNNPMISTVDGQPAMIQVGKEIPQRNTVTQVNNGTMFSESNTVYRQIGTSLYVIPRVDERTREISMLIHPILSQVEDEFNDHYKTESSGGIFGFINTLTGKAAGSSGSSSGSYPNIIVRESNSIVRVKAGEEIILGGLIRRERKTRVNKMPILGDAPVIGDIFRHKQDFIDEQELMIILVPMLVDDLPGDTQPRTPVYDLIYQDYKNINEKHDYIHNK